MIEENVSSNSCDLPCNAFFERTDYYGTLKFLSKMKGSGLGPNKDSFLIIQVKFLKLK
jgi:hypothetical protein